MRFFNIGIQEILFVLVIMLIFTGPESLKDNARKLGRLLRRVLHSETWQTVKKVDTEVRKIPEKLMQEAELEELQGELNSLNHDIAQADAAIRAEGEHTDE